MHFLLLIFYFFYFFFTISGFSSLSGHQTPVPVMSNRRQSSMLRRISSQGKHGPRGACPIFSTCKLSVTSGPSGSLVAMHKIQPTGQPEMCLLTHDFPVGTTSFQTIVSPQTINTLIKDLTLYLTSLNALGAHLAQPQGRPWYLPTCYLLTPGQAYAQGHLNPRPHLYSFVPQ